MTTTRPGRRRRRGQPKGRQSLPSVRAAVRDCIEGLPLQRDLLIEHLHRLQDRYGHISADHIVALAEEHKLSAVEVYEVATFYHHFDVIKEGEVSPPALTVRVCDSVTCELFGADDLTRDLETSLGSAVRVQRVPCVGRCDQAPVAVVGKNPLGHATRSGVAGLV